MFYSYYINISAEYSLQRNFIIIQRVFCHSVIGCAFIKGWECCMDNGGYSHGSAVGIFFFLFLFCDVWLVSPSRFYCEWKRYECCCFSVGCVCTLLLLLKVLKEFAKFGSAVTILLLVPCASVLLL